MTYGGNAMETHRQAGLYAGRILKGEKPADLPVVQAATVEMVVNIESRQRAWDQCSADAARPRRRLDRIGHNLLGAFGR
jgi:putative ABC transport system substrate-binding protein